MSEQHLPIHISQEELQENPGFAALLQELSTNHVTPEGISKDKAKKLEHCTIALQRERTHYIQSLLYYTAVNDLLLDYKLSNKDSSQEDTRIFDMLARALNTAEASIVLSENSNYSSRISAQSLREFQIGNEDALKQQVKILGTALIPKLENYVEEKCIALADFYDPASLQQKRELQLAKGAQLAELVANKKQHNTLLSQAIQTDSLHNTHAFWEYYKVLESITTTLHSLITTYKLREENQDTATDPYVLTAEWQRVRLETLKLKLGVVAKQLAQDTYGERDDINPIDGLRTIARHLAQAVTQARALHEKVVARKFQYESVGLGLPQLASAYGKLLKAIANKEWAIRELDSQ